MAQNIVGGLFGQTTQDVYDNYAAQDRANAIALMNSPTKNQMGIFYGSQIGSGLGRAAASLLGAEDPRLQQAKQIEQVKQWIAQSGIDMNTPEGLAQAAQYAQSIGAVEGAMFFGQQAMAAKQQLATTQRTEQQAAREQQKFNLEDQLRSELAGLSPDATEEDVIAVVRKYGSPDTILKALETKATKLATEGASGVPGPVGKAGAYRDVDGTIIGTAEMAKQRAGFKGAQELMKELDSITVDDVRAAYSPIGVDWTTKEGWQKKLAGAGTVDAQTKIAVAKLNQVIDSLPPGSASDADMKQALSGFPGYGDTEALVNWINRAKEKIQFILDGFSTQFAWKPRATSSGALNLKGDANRQIVKTGKDSKGNKVVQYSDGSVEYAD